MFIEDYSREQNKSKKDLKLVAEINGHYEVIKTIPLPVAPGTSTRPPHFSRRRIIKHKSRIVLYEAVTVTRWHLHLFCATWVRYTTQENEIEEGGGYVLDDKVEVYTQQYRCPYSIQPLYNLHNEGYQKTTFEQVNRDVVAVQKWAMLQPWPHNFIKLGQRLEQ